MLMISVFLITFYARASGVSIVSLANPAAQKAGQELVLDCEFEFEESEATQLDLKWYFNGSPVPIYQWVPSLDLGPQVIDQMFKDNLDLTYQAHSDKLKKHRALHILNPDERFSGNYKCKVSTFVDEDSHENDVTIYVPPNQAMLSPLKVLDNDTSNIGCHATGIYPAPTISLIWTENATVLESNDIVIDSNHANPGLYDASVTASIDPLGVVQQDMISCEITIPGTDFSMRLESEIFEKLDTTQEPEIELEIFSGSASGSGEEDLCESSGDADCDGSGDPIDYEIVDEHFSKVGMDTSTSEEADIFEPRSTSQKNQSIVLLVLLSFVILSLSY